MKALRKEKVMKKNINKKSNKIAAIIFAAVATMAMGMCVGCGASKEAVPAEASNEDTNKAELVTYEFETFDNLKVVIDENSIIAQEPSDDPENSELVSAEAVGNIIAPGRDFVYLEDANNYYVADYSRNLITVADKRKVQVEAVEASEEVEGVGDLIEDTDYAIFDNDVFSFRYDPERFAVTEDELSVTVSFIDEKVQTAGTNVITMGSIPNSDALSIVNTFMELYGASEDERVENYLGGEDVKGYSYSTGILGAADSDLKTCDSYYVVPCGEDVIVINSFRTYGNDMEVENTIDGMFGDLILSFQLD